MTQTSRFLTGVLDLPQDLAGLGDIAFIRPATLEASHRQAALFKGDDRRKASALGMAERFERLEETLQVAHQMFDGNREAFEGEHYQLENPMNHPAPLRRPPIMVGGSGERKTMRLVAQYADANNFFEHPDPEELPRKLGVLRDWCDRMGRAYDDIVKTTFGLMGEPDLSQQLPRFERLAELGTDLAIVDLPDPNDDRGFEFISELVEAVEPMGRPAPTRLGGSIAR